LRICDYGWITLQNAYDAEGVLNENRSEIIDLAEGLSEKVIHQRLQFVQKLFQEFPFPVDVHLVEIIELGFLPCRQLRLESLSQPPIR
jgi:hypothetical protein